MRTYNGGGRLYWRGQSLKRQSPTAAYHERTYHVGTVPSGTVPFFELTKEAKMIAAPVFVPLKHRHHLKARQWQQQRLVYQVADAGSWLPTKLPPESALTIRRDAGLGDCLMIACALAALKQQRPDLRISFAMPPEYTELLSRFEGIDSALRLEDAAGYPQSGSGQPLIELSNYAERHPQANETDRFTLFAQALGLGAGKLPTYRPTSADVRAAEQFLQSRVEYECPRVPTLSQRVSPLPMGEGNQRGEGGRMPCAPTTQRLPGRQASLPVASGTAEHPRVAICMRGKYPHRSWLIPRALQLAQRLLGDGLDAILFDAEERPPYADWIDDVAGTNGPGRLLRAFGLPLPTVAAILSRCRAAVTPDTGFLHLCGCLRVPFVGIFGAIAPQLRTGLYNSHIDLIAHDVPCVPCFEGQQHIACKLQCLQAIGVETVHQSLNKVLAPDPFSQKK